MDTKSAVNNAIDRKFALTYIASQYADLLHCFLTNAVTDIEVASRDLQISDTSFVRLRRAMDRVACAQTVLETMRSGSGGVNAGDAGMRMREPVELLEREWPEDYPAGAMEWLILHSPVTQPADASAEERGPGAK